MRQRGGQGAHEGLGERHADVRPLGRQRAKVALVDDLALVQHQDAVGVGALQHLVEAQRLALQALEAEVVQVAQGHWHFGWRLVAAPYIGGRHRFTDVGVAPAGTGIDATHRVVKGDLFVGGGREALHPAHGVHRGGFGVGQGGGRGLGQAEQGGAGKGQRQGAQNGNTAKWHESPPKGVHSSSASAGVPAGKPAPR